MNWGCKVAETDSNAVMLSSSITRSCEDRYGMSLIFDYNIDAENLRACILGTRSRAMEVVEALTCRIPMSMRPWAAKVWKCELSIPNSIFADSKAPKQRRLCA